MSTKAKKEFATRMALHMFKHAHSVTTPIGEFEWWYHPDRTLIMHAFYDDADSKFFASQVMGVWTLYAHSNREGEFMAAMVPIANGDLDEQLFNYLEFVEKQQTV